MTLEWPQALNCQTYPVYTECPPTETQLSLRFTLWPAILKIQGCRKSSMHQMTPEWPQALKCQTYLVYTEYSPPRPKFHSVSSATSHFRDTRLSKIGNAQNEPRMSSSTYLWKAPYIHWKLTPEAQMLLRFALWSLVFQTIGLFDFSIVYNCEFHIFEKKIVTNQKLKISKIPNAVL